MHWYMFFRFEKNEDPKFKGKVRWVYYGKRQSSEDLSEDELKKHIIKKIRAGEVESGLWRVQRCDDFGDTTKFTESLSFNISENDAWFSKE